MTPQSLLLPCRRATKLATGTTGSTCSRFSTGNRTRQGLHGASATSTPTTPAMGSMITSTNNSNGSKASKHKKVHNLNTPTAAAPWIKVNESNLSAPSAPSTLYAQFNQKGSEQTKANTKCMVPQGTIAENDKPTSSSTDTLPSKVYSQLIKPQNKPTKNKNKKNQKAKDHSKKLEFLIPGAPIAAPYYYFKRVLWKRTLPTLNISSLFDAASREDLLQVLRDEVPKHTRSPFLITGHAVPTQLLQDHLQFADSILSQHEGQECSFNNFHGDPTFDDWYVVSHDSDFTLFVSPKLSTSQSQPRKPRNSLYVGFEFEAVMESIDPPESQMSCSIPWISISLS